MSSTQSIEASIAQDSGAAPRQPSGRSDPVPASGDRRAASKTTVEIQEGRNLCVFWIGHESYAIDVAFVSEAITIPSIRSVPGTPKELLGMVNLRGTALAVVELADVLELPRVQQTENAGREGSTILILSQALLHAGLKISRVDSVVPYQLDQLCKVNDRAVHPIVSGVLKLESRGGAGITILNGNYLLDRLKAIRDTLRRPRFGTWAGTAPAASVSPAPAMAE